LLQDLNHIARLPVTLEHIQTQKLGPPCSNNTRTFEKGEFWQRITPDCVTAHEAASRVHLKNELFHGEINE
jgi:hypothetical protein